MTRHIALLFPDIFPPQYMILSLAKAYGEGFSIVLGMGSLLMEWVDNLAEKKNEK